MIKFFKSFSGWLDPSITDTHLEAGVGDIYTKVRGALGLALVGFLITFLAAIAVWVIDAKTPPPTYLATTPKGVSGSIPLLTEPVYSSTKVQDWTVGALKDTFSFNFVNLDEQLARSQAYFTPDGWDAFYAALTISKVQDTVRKSRLDVWLTPLSEARIVGSCVVDACRYKFWRLEVPVIVTYTGAAPMAARKQLISVMVLRVPTTDNPNGLGISQLSVQDLQ